MNKHKSDYIFLEENKKKQRRNRQPRSLLLNTSSICIEMEKVTDKLRIFQTFRALSNAICRGFDVCDCALNVRINKTQFLVFARQNLLFVHFSMDATEKNTPMNEIQQQQQITTTLNKSFTCNCRNMLCVTLLHLECPTGNKWTFALWCTFCLWLDVQPKITLKLLHGKKELVAFCWLSSIQQVPLRVWNFRFHTNTVVT